MECNPSSQRVQAPLCVINSPSQPAQTGAVRGLQFIWVYCTMHSYYECSRCGKSVECCIDLPATAGIMQRANAQASIRNQMHRAGWRNVYIDAGGTRVARVCKTCIKPDDAIREGV